MAKNVKINGVTYQNVPEVDIPLATGSGTAKFHDTTGATAEAADVLSGETAYGANGAITGSMPNNGSTSGTITTKGGTVTIPAGYTTGGTVSIASAAVTDLTAQNLLSGETAFGANGAITGSMPNNGSTSGTITTKGGTVTIPAGYTTGGTVNLGNVTDLTAQNLLSGKTVLGVAGALTLPTISQDATTKVLSIS